MEERIYLTDEHILSFQARFSNGDSYVRFIIVHLSGVNVSVSSSECLKNGFGIVDLVDTEAQERYEITWSKTPRIYCNETAIGDENMQ